MLGAMLFLTLTIVAIPESPKFYYARNRFDDARRSLRIIAWVNGAKAKQDILSIRFDTESILKEEG